MSVAKKLVFPELISLKSKPEYSEIWVKNAIVTNPSILGLGEVVVRDSERIQPRGGRLDLLLQDIEEKRRYEVELQLGRTDESHIIRTIEYWDVERKRFPNYDHCAVIVAEEITSRFFNVISLFNGQIPLIALQVSGYEIDGNVMLTFTRVLDEVQRGDEIQDEIEVTDRSYWISRGTLSTMKVVDELFALVKQIAPQYELKYNKFYMGLAENGKADNFSLFRAFKNFARIEIKLPKSKELEAQLADKGFDDCGYDSTWGKYKIDVKEGDLKNNIKKEFLVELIKRSYLDR